MSTEATESVPPARLRALLRPARPDLAKLVALSLGITATYVGQGLLVAGVFGTILDGGSVGAIVPALVGVVACQLIRSGLLLVREVVAVRCAAAVKDDLRSRLYRTLMALGPGEVRRRRTGELQALLIDIVEQIDPYVGRFLPLAIASIVGALAIAGLLISLDPTVGLVVGASAALVPLVPWISERLVRSRMTPWMTDYRGLYAENLDAVQGMTTLKVFGASARWGRQLHDRAEAFCTSSIRLCGIVVIYVAVVGGVVGVGTALAVGLGALRRVDGLISTADLLVVLLLARECFRPLRQLQDAFHSAAPARTAAATIDALLTAEVPVASPSEPAQLAAGHTPPSITFEGVRFAYPGREELAVDGIDLQVAAGERVALVGRSGAGKTTLVSLLLRWYDPASGRILLDRHDLRTLDLVDLRSSVALVSQDTYLFHGTVRDNVALARPDADDDTLRRVLADAQAGFVKGLPDGLDTLIGERGMKLSGGERQRLAIARALLIDAPVLVLDEATSSLDAANETGLTEALERLSHGRTTLTIAHRLSTVRDADRIVVLEAGRVAQSGTWEELADSEGAFARLAAAGVVQQ